MTTIHTRRLQKIHTANQQQLHTRQFKTSNNTHETSGSYTPKYVGVCTAEQIFKYNYLLDGYQLKIIVRGRQRRTK